MPRGFLKMVPKNGIHSLRRPKKTFKIHLKKFKPFNFFKLIVCRPKVSQKKLVTYRMTHPSRKWTHESRSKDVDTNDKMFSITISSTLIKQNLFWVKPELVDFEVINAEWSRGCSAQRIHHVLASQKSCVCFYLLLPKKITKFIALVFRLIEL